MSRLFFLLLFFQTRSHKHTHTLGHESSRSSWCLQESMYLFPVFTDEGRQQVSVRGAGSMSFQFEDLVDQRRTKEEVVTQTHKTGGKPVQSHGLGGRAK